MRRNLFYRFFGLGAGTTRDGESSYTRTTALFEVRGGLNFAHHLNAGLRLGGRADRLERHAIFHLPTLQDLHPDAPGLGGAGQSSASLSLRYDTRDGGDYAVEGVGVEVAGASVLGLRAFDRFWRLTGQARALLREASFLQGEGRIYWTEELGGAGVPFYYQSALGGELLFRGFPDDRFIDRGAWEAELEQRIRVLQTHFFHVVTDWRVDPFIALGQVYQRRSELVERPRLAAGVGFRAWVRPNVLGRVDVAYAGEGVQAYVVLGYPY